jgi:cellobiose phosphorylase
MYGLYRRGFVPEALAIFRDMYALTMDSARSRVFPCIPSYFDKFGHGAYCYLTGSATWLLMAVLTQMFGLRGERGDLCIQPRLRKDQFGADGETGVAFNMFGRRLDVRIRNRHGLDWGRYRVTAVRINATVLPGASTPDQAVIVPRDEVLRLCTRRVNRVRIDLGR